MAAPSEESTLVAPAGYIAISIQFSEERPTHHCLYAKEHKVREKVEQSRPLNRTLFVINIPPYCTEKCLSQIFASCGTVVSVELQDKPGPSKKCNKEVRSKYFDHNMPKGFKVGYIVFKKDVGPKELKHLKLQKPYVMSENLQTVKTGIHKWIEDYEESLTDTVDLQNEIDNFMKEYDKKLAEEDEKAKLEEGIPDEDGWVKVTRKGRRPGLARTEAVNLRVMEREKKKRAQKELLNFYAWQHHDSKREHLAELRKKFEEDKQKIALMRAQRKFRPY
uniref:Ribosomal RNA processing 7 homolog A n=1 Tax=Leptobrachium leishanense TaxID=445787 RepID=A0A8C5PT22_9ANUR